VIATPGLSLLRRSGSITSLLSERRTANPSNDRSSPLTALTTLDFWRQRVFGSNFGLELDNQQLPSKFHSDFDFCHGKHRIQAIFHSGDWIFL
jgi:hypothetical protein